MSTLLDFWDLGRNTLVDFLAVYRLKTSGEKAELVANAYLAVELTMQGDLKCTPHATH